MQVYPQGYVVVLSGQFARALAIFGVQSASVEEGPSSIVSFTTSPLLSHSFFGEPTMEYLLGRENAVLTSKTFVVPSFEELERVVREVVVEYFTLRHADLGEDLSELAERAVKAIAADVRAKETAYAVRRQAAKQ